MNFIARIKAFFARIRHAIVEARSEQLDPDVKTSKKAIAIRVAHLGSIFLLSFAISFVLSYYWSIWVFKVTIANTMAKAAPAAFVVV